MSDPTPIDTPEAAARRAALARQRFFMIGLFRLSGAAILLFGMAISLQRFGWVQGNKAKWMGIIVSTVGFIQFMLVPRMLARAFATPKERP
jgi:uncharacterized membrane protein YcjF (UPF0283 family)